jgi:hypothetical protein
MIVGVFNNLLYTIHLRQEHVVVPMDQEIVKVFYYGAVRSSYALLIMLIL